LARATILAVAAVMMAASAALAAPLSDSDNRYLRDEFGPALGSDMIKDLSADERTRLHEIINDPYLKSYPYARDHNVADFLFGVYMRGCSVWALSHTGPECPPASDAGAEPGKEIADRQCNACHLVGTMDAPSFYKLVKEGKLSEQELTAALDHGHMMSRINLSPAQISELIAYTHSLK